jgi:hypothetical protein
MLKMNTRTGAAVGKPLEGHSDSVLSIAYIPDGTSSLDLVTTRFESGMPRLMPEWVGL